MPTYTIVSADQNPLGPGEINAGETISVSPGDVFIVDPSANSNINFVTSGGGPHDFDVVFNDSNANNFNVTVASNLKPTVTVADNAGLSDVDIAAQGSDGLTLNVGDNATLGKLDGSSSGADNIAIGNGFTATGDWNTLGGDDVLLVGDDATFLKLKTGTGNDSVTFGDRATFNEVDTEDGNDTISIGDDANGNKIKAGGGDDTVHTGNREEITTVDGGAGNDSYTTQTSGTNSSNMESTTMVCYAPGTMIDTPGGPRAIEDLLPGDLVLTVDHGPQPIRWIRSSDHPLEEADVDNKPVLIQAGALGAGRPAQDLIVSPQHRILVGGGGQLNGWFKTEVFAPAKSLTSLPGIRHMKGKQSITWIHFACDRHEVVTANGCLAESLLLGPMVVNGLTRKEWRELTDIYGSVEMPDAALNGSEAREYPKVSEVRRHLAKCKKDNEPRIAKEIKKWDLDLAMEKYEADRLSEAAA
jgi:hypothetical protein